MTEKLPSNALDRLFYKARTCYNWLTTEIPKEILVELVRLTLLGPTSMNCCPIRIVFVQSKEQKERLSTCVNEGNVPKILNAPITTILAYDTKFYEKLSVLFPKMPNAADMYKNNSELVKITAFRNSSLEGGYFILAARALGLDCGPMSGFDNKKLDKEFFPDGNYKSNFLCNIGYGDYSNVHSRFPRSEVEEIYEVL